MKTLFRKIETTVSHILIININYGIARYVFIPKRVTYA